MKKNLLLFTVFLFLSSCNQNQESRSLTEQATKDTVARNSMNVFSEKPNAENIYVKVEIKDQNVYRQQDASIRKLLSALKKPSQRFVIDATAKSEVKGEHGTKISFEPNCFVSENGNEISSQVDIELRECYTLAEMLQENLATTSDDKILESKGMIFVSATSRGEQLRLKGGEKMQVEFPFVMNDFENYTFFYGENKTADKLNWKLVNEADARLADYNSNGTTCKQLQNAEFSYHGLELKDYLISQLDYPESAKRNELSENVEVHLLIDTNGKAILARAPSVYKAFRDEIDSVISNMPAWKPTTYGEEKYHSAVKFNIDFNIRKRQQTAVEYNRANVIVITNWTGSEFFDDGRNFFSNRIFSKSFNKMGWINCERFMSFPQPKADVIVRADSKSDVRIVLKNMNSVMSGETCVGYSRFRNLPVDIEAVIVAIRYEEGNIFYSVQPLKLEKQTIVTPVWRKGNEDEIAKVFRNLNEAI